MCGKAAGGIEVLRAVGFCWLLVPAHANLRPHCCHGGCTLPISFPRSPPPAWCSHAQRDALAAVRMLGPPLVHQLERDLGAANPH